MNTLARIIKILEAELSLEEREAIGITESTALRELGADSMDLAEIAIEIEEEFDIGISDEECDKIATVGDLLRIVEAKK